MVGPALGNDGLEPIGELRQIGAPHIAPIDDPERQDEAPWRSRGKGVELLGCTDKIDVQACTENDVALFNAPQALNHSTASSALLFMLALAKRLPEQERIVRLSRWDRQAEVMGSEIQGRTLGIVGLGHSGRELMRLAAPFDLRVLAHSPHADPDQARRLGVELTTLETLLREADFVSLHCRLDDSTRGLIGASQLALMKPTAILINTSRGPIVQEAALLAALRERRIAGYGADTFDVEPLPPDHPLRSEPRALLTPHLGYVTEDTYRVFYPGMVAAIEAWLDGRPIGVI